MGPGNGNAGARHHKIYMRQLRVERWAETASYLICLVVSYNHACFVDNLGLNQ